MEVLDTDLPGVRIVVPARHGDHRGFFSETWNRARFDEHGIAIDWIQDNHSRSAAPGTVRGLHYQSPPFAQDKLVRVVVGAVMDVAVDIRHGSPTFGRHVAVELSAKNGRQLLVPRGFAHGFATLAADTEVLYKVSAPYAPEHDHGILWNDPALGIDWGIDEAAAVLSAKDHEHPVLARAPAHFTHAGG